MKTHPVSAEPVLGLDVAQASFVAVLRVDPTRQVQASFPNHAGGFHKLDTWLHQHFAGRVRAGLEATGIYGRKLAHWLHEKRHTVHLLNPARVAAYGRCTGQRNKTDPADARTIAAYVAKHELPVWCPAPEAQVRLQEYCRLRTQLGHQRQQLKNQFHSAGETARPYLQRIVRALEAEMEAITKAIKAHLAQHPDLELAVRRLTTVPGIGDLSAAVILSELPTIDKDSDPRALSAWCGLIPARHQSGLTEGRSHLSRAGNAHLRQALFMPALVAKRYNPVLKAFAERLAAKGKRHGAILGAVAHKLLRILIGLLRHQQDFDPNWSPQKN